MIKEKLNKIPIGIRASFVYILSSVLTKGLVIITMPIFTRIMTTEQIGEVNIYNTWYSLLIVVVNLSLTSGGFQSAMKDYEKDRDRYISSIMTLTLISSIVFAIVYFVAPLFWNKVFGLSTELMILMILSFAIMPAKEFWLLKQRYEYKYKLAGGLTILNSILSTIMAIIVVISLNQNGSNKVVEGRLYATNLITIFISLIIMIYIYAKGKTLYNKKFWKNSLILSIPLIGYALANQVLNVSDRIMIDKMIGESAVGIYGTLYNISTIPTLVWSAINSAFIPFLFQNIDKDLKSIKKYSFILLALYSLVAIVITYLAPEIVMILATKEYFVAISIIPPIAAGIFLTSVINMYSNILVYYKKTHYIMISAIIAAIVNIVLNYFFINEFGYMAAAYTTLVSYIILAFLQFIFAKIVVLKLTEKKEIYYDKYILLMSIITILLSLLGLFFYENIILRYIVISIGIVVSICVGTIALKKMKKNTEDKKDF